MLFTFALIFLGGVFLGKVFQFLKLPNLLGMLIAGILLGPSVLNLIDPSTAAISSDLRKIALIIILTRAGMNLDINKLKKVGRPAILMCFVPACFEIVGVAILAPPLLGISVLEALVVGTVLAAVSPAVIVPKMLKLKEEGYGVNKSIPQIIMAGASVDDVFVIVLFTTFSELVKTGNVNALNFLTIPTSIIFGIIGGVICGVILHILFNKIKTTTDQKVLIILSISFLFLTLEKSLDGLFVGFSGSLAVMSLGIFLNIKDNKQTEKLAEKFGALWSGAEILLFVLVGATVNVNYAISSGINTVLLILLVLIFRILGVFACLLKTNLNIKEKVFMAMSYIPKATVQAAIGGLPLAMGLAVGDTALTVAVVSILITAPVGAFLVDIFYKKCLTHTVENKE